MKGSVHYGKGNQSKGATPMTGSPNKFLGGMLKKIGGAAKGALMGKDGKFGIKDAGRLALGPLGAIGGATGLFTKEDQMKKETKKKEEKVERNQWGETPAEYKKRVQEMGLAKPEKKKAPVKNYKKGYYGA